MWLTNHVLRTFTGFIVCLIIIGTILWSQLLRISHYRTIDPERLKAISFPLKHTVLSNHNHVTNGNPIRCRRKIDIVYTWVNGSSPKFQRSLMKWSALLGKGKDNKRAKRAARYFDWDTMKYSIRSVEMFFPCTRKFYIVTNGQVPNWLDLLNPKVRLITHDDIFPNKSHLPTFNSNAIEHHLHQIKGLSEKFLYFNDDFFLSNNITLQDLFDGENGQNIYTETKISQCYPGCDVDKTNNKKCNLACNNTLCNFDGNDCLAQKKKISFETSTTGSDIYLLSLAVSNGILSETFGVDKRYLISHVPYFLDKKIIAQYTKAFKSYIDKTSSNKFRTATDIQLPFAYLNFLMSKKDRMKGICGKKCKLRYSLRAGSRFVEFVGINSNANTVRTNLERWSQRRRKFAFLQDGTSGDNPDNDKSHKVLLEHLERMFPRRSQFEKYP